MTVRVSGGDLCEAEAPTEAAAETKDASKMSAQSEGRDLISGSLTSDPTGACMVLLRAPKRCFTAS